MPRPVSEKESLRLLKTIFKGQDEFLGINWGNHRKADLAEDCYRITMNLLSLNTLIKLMENRKVKKVFFHPSAAPFGSGADGIALRYRLYIQYHKVASRRKSAT